MRRLLALVSYIWRELFRSFSGLFLIVVVAVFYLVGIKGVVGGIDRDYYALLIGGFFGLFCLILTILLSDRAFHARTTLLIYRCPTRASFLAGISLASILISGVFEFIVGVISLPFLTTTISPEIFVDILPVWTSWLILGTVLGLLMSELVRLGWSRTIVYAILAFILFSLNQQQSGVPVGLADRFSWLPRLTSNPGQWNWAIDLTNVLLLPITATIKILRSVPYTPLESTGPAMIILVSAFLFWLAAKLFANKDLVFPEG